MCRDVEKELADMVCSKDTRPIVELAAFDESWLCVEGTIDKIPRTV